MPIRSRENVVGAYAFLAGVVLALMGGILTTLANNQANPFILLILAALGLVVGYFVSEKDVQTFLLVAVAVVLVSFAGMQGLVLGAAVKGLDISQLIVSILGALLFLFIPATIIVAIKTVFSISKS